MYNYKVLFQYNGKEYSLDLYLDKEYNASSLPVELNDQAYLRAKDYLEQEGLWKGNSFMEELCLYKGKECLFDYHTFNK